MVIKLASDTLSTYHRYEIRNSTCAYSDVSWRLVLQGEGKVEMTYKIHTRNKKVKRKLKSYIRYILEVIVKSLYANQCKTFDVWM